MPREESTHDPPSIRPELGAKATAHVVGQDAYARRLDLNTVRRKAIRDLARHGRNRLCRRVDRAGGEVVSPLHQLAVRFETQMRDLSHPQVTFHDDMSLLKRHLWIAHTLFLPWPGLGSIFQASLIDEVRKHFIFDVDEPQGITRDVLGGRRDCHNLVVRPLHARTLILNDVHRPNPVEIYRFGDLELADHSVCVRARQKTGMKHSGQCLICRVLRPAGDLHGAIETRGATA